MEARIGARALAAVLTAALFCGASARAAAAATTWSPHEVECPVCKTKNVFMTWVSYGNYIYQWESKFQLIFWPLTAEPVVYSCKKCRLSAFMGDFERVPKEKHAEILKRLEGVRLEYARPRAGHDDGADYLRIPVTDRLLAAERVYKVLERGDEFWCQFYRTLGYHFEAEKKQAQADEARREALRLAERMLAGKAHAGERKELLYITGAMRHFLRDDRGALRDFREAQELKYRNANVEGGGAGYDEFLSDLLRQYVELLGGAPKGKTPKG